MICVTLGYVNSGILLTVPRQIFYSLFLSSPEYESTLRTFCLCAFHCAGQKKSAGLKLLLSFPLKTSTPHLNSPHLLHVQSLSWECSQNRGSHKTFFAAYWVVKITNSFFPGILAVYSFGPRQGIGIAEKSIFQVMNLNILKLEGKEKVN